MITRQSAIFSWPILKKVRNFFYKGYLDTTDLHVDDFVRIGPAHLTKESFLKVGSGLRASRNSEIDSSGGLTIGDRVTFSEDAKVYTHDHVINGGKVDWRKNGLKLSSLEIKSDAWIGAGAIILPSVNSIGYGAVIGSGAVVINDIPDLAIAVGNPAKVVKIRDCTNTDCLLKNGT